MVSIMKESKMVISLSFKIPTSEVDKNDLRAKNKTSLSGTLQGVRRWLLQLSIFKAEIWKPI